MPKLAIIDHVVSAAGVERFLHGLLAGMLQLPEIDNWDITILLAKRNSGGYEVKWPEHLTCSNLQLCYLRNDRFSSLLDRLLRAERVCGVRGTGRIQRLIPRLLKRYGTGKLRGYVGDIRLWIENFCRQQDFDVIYFSYPYLMDCPELPMPMITTPHDFNHKRFNTFGPKMRAQIDHQMPRWLRQSKFLVVSSEFIASELQHFYPEFADKVRIVRLGIPSASRIPSVEEIEAQCQRMGLPKVFLLTTGWIVPHKNQVILFKALGKLRNQGISIPLVCVGPNSDQLQPEKRKRAAGYVHEVLDTAIESGLEYGRDYWGFGYVDDFALECLYRRAFALVVPTLYEAGSFPAREAMKDLCPVICSNIPALMEEARLVDNSIWLFDPADSDALANTIQYMLNNYPIVLQRAQRAQRLVKSVYSWKKTAAGYLSVFQEAMASQEGRIA